MSRPALDLRSFNAAPTRRAFVASLAGMASSLAAVGSGVSLLAAGSLALPTYAAAADWAPTKTVRIVVPIVGGTNDVVARLVAPELQKVLGQAVIVENRGGAGGNIGANDVAKAAPDGHTLLVGFNGPIAINTTLFSKLPYDPVKDLAPITLAVTRRSSWSCIRACR